MARHADIPASLPRPGQLQHLEGRLTERESATTENLARTPTIKGKLVGPLLAQEAALAAQTHLGWPCMRAQGR